VSKKRHRPKNQARAAAAPAAAPAPARADERRTHPARPPGGSGATYIGAGPGWHVVWVGTEPPFTLFRHEVIAWRIGTHQRVVPITVDDVPSDYAIEHGGRLYSPFVEQGTPARVYNSVDEYHRNRISAIERAAYERERAHRESERAQQP
jgi:hypothetical protein